MKRLLVCSLMVLLITSPAKAATPNFTGAMLLHSCKEALLTTERVKGSAPWSNEEVASGIGCQYFLMGMAAGVLASDVVWGVPKANVCPAFLEKKNSELIGDFVAFAMSEKEEQVLKADFRDVVFDYYSDRCKSRRKH